MNLLHNYYQNLDWIGRVLGLQEEAFQQIAASSDGLISALIIVVIAGLSIAIAQSIILFINRVTPLRFIFSLLINTVLFAFGYLFLVLTTWVICWLPGFADVPLLTLVEEVGFSYSPLIFGCFGALPYLGVPILSLLSVWHLLAMVVAIATVANVSEGIAFWYVALGWVVLQILQQTIGQPIANLGRGLANWVAGVQLISEKVALVHQVSSSFTQPPSPLTTSAARSPGQSSPKASANVKEQVIFALGLVGMAFLAFLVALLLQPLRDAVFSHYEHIPRAIRYGIDLVWIGVVAIAFAGLLAPLETLGWWAGWYNDEVDTTINTGTLAEPDRNPSGISRYLIYLDGIGQSGSQYLPDVEEFLDALTVALPDDVALIRGLMSYSVLNNPLDEDRPLAFLWQFADKLRFANPANVLGAIVNIRNVLIVSVSADQRYGPLYNRGIAQILFNSLVNNGYTPRSGIPITLIGYSGGGQMAAAAAPFLKRAIDAPLDVISLGGVISGNCDVLKLEHLYHLFGEKDSVEQIGPIVFPGRWQLFCLSYWNRAKKLGRISLISLGAVGHQVPGGLMDPKAYLPDGRSYLQQTIDFILEIIEDRLSVPETLIPAKPSNYENYQQADFNRPEFYPLNQSIDLDCYRAIAPWMGRLILPQQQERRQVRGVKFEVHHTAPGYEDLVGQIVYLRWIDEASITSMVRAVRRDVYFSPNALYTSEYGGLIHPVRLNHWRQVGPLESLAGSHSRDDVIVMLAGEVIVEPEETPCLRIKAQPVQITGRYYALVRFVSATGDLYRVVHFNPDSRDFDGSEETVRVPQVIADVNGCYPSSNQNLDKSPLNEMGWYIYGAKDASGTFIVQSLAPRSLLRLQPERIILGKKAVYKYIRQETWANIAQAKGKISSVLLSHPKTSNQAAINEWQEGTKALVLHVYGGIGGKKTEPAARSPIFFGHFAYGIAQVVWEPLAAEKRFEINYHQVYTHNTDGLIAGTLHWSRFLGDRQFGWVGVRPTCDLIVKLDAFNEELEFYENAPTVLDLISVYLQAMTARYRIGDGTGGTYVGPANNCAQDSNHALFSSLQAIERALTIERFSARILQLIKLGKALKRQLQPLGAPRNDWENNEFNLGSALEDAPLTNFKNGLGSWRTLLPRLASDTVVRVFLQQDAAVWVLRTNQIGGEDPDIEPIKPMTL
ncbi:CAAX protease [Merismopedia glauca]|uniref:CAAX protease n=1 Tax=Merismopedia glauca CCAP 1448/3 TaxID=1296344 RepID=A0A2T1BYU7_9CYAN|nr:CAAX protease [Merismopedia glauca]PSB01087.1 CAAX protease [Merismopedia glauca CCAP 1448/3]